MIIVSRGELAIWHTGHCPGGRCLVEAGQHNRDTPRPSPNIWPVWVKNARADFFAPVHPWKYPTGTECSISVSKCDSDPPPRVRAGPCATLRASRLPCTDRARSKIDTAGTHPPIHLLPLRPPGLSGLSFLAEQRHTAVQRVYSESPRRLQEPGPERRE